MVCSIASTNLNLTIGYIDTGNCLRPKSLISGDSLDHSKKQSLFLILKKSRSERLYKNMIFGSVGFLEEYSDQNPQFKALLKIDFKWKIDKILLVFFML